MRGTHDAAAEAPAPDTARSERPALSIVRPGATDSLSYIPSTPWTTPPGYEMRRDGVFELVMKKEPNAKGEVRLVQKAVLQAHTPIWIVGRVYDIDTKWVAYTVAAVTSEGKQVERTLAGDQVRNQSKLTALALYDFPVDSGNAAGVVRYLSAAIAANGAQLPTTHAASKMVWRKMRAEATLPDAFNLGFRLIRANEPDAMIAPAVHSGIDPMHFERFMPKGTEEAWAAAVLPWLKAHPTVATMACVGLASPLCHLLGIPNRIFEMAGNSGLGKTSTAQLAMSLWGNPDDKKLPGWNGTAVGLERTAAMHGNCLLIVDENAQHGRGGDDKGSFAKALFQLAEGKSKPRSNENLGLRTPDVWRLNIITTGEVSGHASTEHGGILSRVISFWGSPLGGKSAETGERIKETLAVSLAHHGHTAPEFIKDLLTLDDESMAAMKAHHVALQKEYVLMVKGTADATLAARWSTSYAAMHIAAEWLEEAYPDHLPKGSLTAHLKTSWLDACSKVRNIDPSANALDKLRDWLVANDHRILLPDGTGGGGTQEAIGIRLRDGNVAIIPASLERARLITDLPSVLNGWNDAGLLETDKDRVKKTIKIGTKAVKAIVFKGDLLWPVDAPAVSLTPLPEAPLEDVTPVLPSTIASSEPSGIGLEDEIAEWNRLLDATGI